MRIQLKKVFLISQIFVFLACSSKIDPKITISKVNGSPAYENSKITSVEQQIVNNEYEFTFELEDYELGVQTKTEYDYHLANSDKGQHIHFIINNEPYSAHYSENFSKKMEDENNVILAFLSRSHHESVKNQNAYILTQISDEPIDLNNEFLFYSRPKGTYKGKDTEKVLLDFYLVNTEISTNGNKVRATIGDTVFLIDEWAPYYIEGLNAGDTQIKLELIDLNGNLIDVPFNPSIKTVTIEK